MKTEAMKEDSAKRSEQYHEERRLIEAAQTMAYQARQKFGPHPTADFAACRVAEEVGELVQATTAVSKDRGVNRRERVFAEAVDVIAMTLRLVREFPDGAPATVAEREKPKAIPYGNVIDSIGEGMPPFLQPPSVTSQKTARAVAENAVAEAFARGVALKMEFEGCVVHKVWIDDKEVDLGRGEPMKVKKFEVGTTLSDSEVAERARSEFLRLAKKEGWSIDPEVLLRAIFAAEVKPPLAHPSNGADFGAMPSASISEEDAKAFIERRRSFMPIGKPLFAGTEEQELAICVQQCSACNTHFRIPDSFEFHSITRPNIVSRDSNLPFLTAKLTCPACEDVADYDLPLGSFLR